MSFWKVLFMINLKFFFFKKKQMCRVYMERKENTYRYKYPA